MANPTFGVGYVRGLLDHAIRRGGDRRALLAAAGLVAEDLVEHDGRVPLANCSALMAAATEATQDPAFALRFGEGLKEESLSVAWLAAAAAETVGEGRSAMNRFGRLIGDGGGAEVLQLVRDREGVWLQFVAGADDWRFVEAGFAWCVTAARRMLAEHHGGRPFLKAVRFRHGEPSYRAEYDRIFAAPCAFEAAFDGMLIDEGFLQLRLPPSNPYVAQLLTERAENLSGQLDKAATVRGQLEQWLQGELGARGARMDAVARQLGVSRRTLARRLRAEGTTFERVLTELRRDLAVRCLSGGKTSVKQAAYRLGFSDPAAFSRAFKRWTGSSPSTIGRT